MILLGGTSFRTMAPKAAPLSQMSLSAVWAPISPAPLDYPKGVTSPFPQCLGSCEESCSQTPQFQQNRLCSVVFQLDSGPEVEHRPAGPGK